MAAAKQTAGKERTPFPEEAWRQSLILIARELPGQFPGEELYNLDVRDELRWMIEARRKQLLRDMSQLQMVNLATAGGEEAKKMFNDLLNEYSALEGIDRIREEIDANWESLKMKGRG